MQALLQVLSDDHPAADAALAALAAHCAAAADAAAAHDDDPSEGYCAGGGGFDLWGGGGGGGAERGWGEMGRLAAGAVDGVGGLVAMLAEWVVACRDGDRCLGEGG